MSPHSFFNVWMNWIFLSHFWAVGQYCHSKCMDRKMRHREMRQPPWGQKDILWHKRAESALPLGYASSFHKLHFCKKVLIQSWISARFLKVIFYPLLFCLLCSPLLLHFLTQPVKYFISEVIIFTKPGIFTWIFNFIYHTRSVS